MNKNAERNYDLLIVGAGIYGAWLAYDASLRGLKTLIIDKGDIASGTSSASSKLIHGGLRYLEQFDFSLVKKSVKERQRLLKIAPHRVKPLKFGIPVYKGGRISSWKYKIGLTIYDWFAKVKNKDFKHESFSAEQFSKKFPILKKHLLKNGYTYQDANTDDFRYTLEIIDGAVKNGAELKTYSELIKYESNQALIKNVFSNQEITINFKVAINATGQWTDELFNTNYCRLSKGIHIVVPDVKLKDALLLLSPIDQRVFFVIPWYGKTMIGTTDTDFTGKLDSIKANKDDINYLIESFNYYSKELITENDVISSFAGLRVLKNTKGHPSSVSRDWEWKELQENVYISLGGKLTSSREDCSELINVICKKLKYEAKCTTHEKMFPWTPSSFDSWKHKTRLEAKKLNLNEFEINNLISRHGKRTTQILDLIRNDKKLSDKVLENVEFTKAELHFIVANEYVTCFQDLIRRRFPLTLITKLNQDQLKELRGLANKTLKDLGKEKLAD